MSRRLLYAAVSISSLAMLLFVAGFACLQLGLGLLMALFYAVAGKIMLLAFGLLLLWGVVGLLIALWREVRIYFRREAAALRRLLAVKARHDEAQASNLHEARQLRYWSHFKRQRLLAANNRKHLRALFQSINRELQAVKSELPAATYKSLRKALRSHHQRADASAMLALRQQIPCR